MTRDIVCAYADQDTEEAAKLMEQKLIRRLPVLNSKNRLVGIVSLGDLAVRTGQAGLAGEVPQRVCEPSPGMP